MYQCIVDFLILRLVQRESPLTFVRKIFPFPYQRAGQLGWEPSRKTNFRGQLRFDSLGARLILLKVWMVRDVWLSLGECHDSAWNAWLRDVAWRTAGMILWDTSCRFTDLSDECGLHFVQLWRRCRICSGNGVTGDLHQPHLTNNDNYT